MATPKFKALRDVVFGRCPERIRAEYFTDGPGLVFREPERELGYGLVVGKTLLAPMIQALLMTIQGHVLSALLFPNRPSRFSKTSSFSYSPLRPSRHMQQEALAIALANIFWKAGGGECTICVPHPMHIFLQPSRHFNEDGVTEKLLLFEVNNYDDLISLLRRHIHVFEEDPGPALLLIIYSSVLCRGIDRVREDLGHTTTTDNKIPNLFRETLICYSGKIMYSTLSLLLTGRATPFLHNGVTYAGNEERFTATQVGITSRSPLGLLIWMGQEDKTAGYRIGSRLKTPIYPIWITIVGEVTGILFTRNRDLMRDYHAENRFDLYYFTSSHYQTDSVVLRVTTKEDEEDKKKKEQRLLLKDGPADEPQQIHALDELIRSKWSEATVNWNGATPFV